MHRRENVMPNLGLLKTYYDEIAKKHTWSWCCWRMVSQVDTIPLSRDLQNVISPGYENEKQPIEFVDIRCFEFVDIYCLDVNGDGALDFHEFLAVLRCGELIIEGCKKTKPSAQMSYTPTNTIDCLVAAIRAHDDICGDTFRHVTTILVCVLLDMHGFLFPKTMLLSA